MPQPAVRAGPRDRCSSSDTGQAALTNMKGVAEAITGSCPAPASHGEKMTSTEAESTAAGASVAAPPLRAGCDAEGGQSSFHRGGHFPDQ